MSRQRFQFPVRHSAAELFIIGGIDQQQVEAQPGASQTAEGFPIYHGYDRGDAAVEAMLGEGRDVLYVATHLPERDEKIKEIQREVTAAAAIEESRRRLAQIFNEMGRRGVAPKE